MNRSSPSETRSRPDGVQFRRVSSPFSMECCGVSPASDGGACNGAALTVIKRQFGGLPPGITNSCSAYVGP
jgi:hypothetical protein